MDALYRFLEHIGYTMLFTLAVTLLVGLTEYTKSSSDAAASMRMDHKNVHMTEGTKETAVVSKAEAYYEIAESNGLTIDVDGYILPDTLLNEAKRHEASPQEIGLTEEHYRKEYEIGTDGKIAGIRYR